MQQSEDRHERAGGLAARIEIAQLRTEPFGYIYHQNAFADSFYCEIIGNLPANRFYRELRHPDALQPDGKSARLSFDLHPENIRRLPRVQRLFWSEFARQLSSAAVQGAFMAKFKKILEEHCQKELARIRLRPWPMLLRDIAGYKISIHPDTPRKAITTQYYLPEDDSQVHLGTVFHERLAQGGFAEATTLPFRPNTGYAFAVTRESWHSVKVMNAGDRPRNTLMVTYIHDRGPLRETLEVLRRKFRAFAGGLGAKAEYQ
jgi:hypothetical protein